MFDKILIANRGEIACRVARTARRMGIRTVAVYSDADASALHVAACDEAYRLGPPPARESYLSGDAIIEIARRSRASAIHPGYGFLSENAPFATACAAAGVVFIGPPPAAIAAMGSKSAAKRIMGDAGVPLVPGYHGDDQEPALLAREAAKIGYPVLIKASAGGGGKGMRIVERAVDFSAALAAAQREAQSAFGDDRVLIEKYLTSPRHIEIQVFGDLHGGTVFLFERDCSIQRRHQKVLEEAPATGMTAQRRRAMGESAIAAAKAIGYVGAGTVEFITQDDAFYFMEMNTRLQVEHPVTEMITGLDLVEWQLRIACGESLPKEQEELSIAGHAIEARIYAEDPDRGFLPSVGRIVHLRAPAIADGVRVDTGVRAGDEISRFYDPMIAKLIVHGRDRVLALKRLSEALAQYEIVGVGSNVAFLRRLVAHDAFARALLDTGFIARHEAELFVAPAGASARVLLAAALAEVLAIAERAVAAARASADPHSPWGEIDPWWLNSDSDSLALTFADGNSLHRIALRKTPGGWRATLPKDDTAAVAATIACRDGPHRSSVEATIAVPTRPQAADIDAMTRSAPARADREPRSETDDHRFSIIVDDERLSATVVAHGEERHVFCAGEHRRLVLVDPLAHRHAQETHAGHLNAPMSGTVVAVNVKPGDSVEKGAALMILEAMKMEHTIAAPARGIVAAVNFDVGERVAEGENLVDIDIE